jgi:hypothetical protein
VIRDGAGRHPRSGRGLEHLADATGAVEHRVLGVCVQVDETHRGGPPGLGRLANYRRVISALHYYHSPGFGLGASG